MTKKQNKLLRAGKLNVEGIISELDEVSISLMNLGINYAEFSLPTFDDLYDGKWFDEEDDWTGITDEEERFIAEEMIKHAEKEVQKYHLHVDGAFPNISIKLMA